MTLNPMSEGSSIFFNIHCEEPQRRDTKKRDVMKRSLVIVQHSWASLCVHSEVQRALFERRTSMSENTYTYTHTLVKCAGLWAEEWNVFWGFYFEEIFYGFE